MPPNNGLAGKVILETQFRKSYPDLATNIKEGFTNWSRSSHRKNSNLFYQSTHYQRPVPIRIDINLIQPVDSLYWQSSSFGSLDAYQFRNGVLHGGFQSSKKSGLEQTGIFRDGVESGIWQYKDSLDQLQYIEEYLGNGSLKKVVHQRGNTFSRSAPLPTL